MTTYVPRNERPEFKAAVANLVEVYGKLSEDQIDVAIDLAVKTEARYASQVSPGIWTFPWSNYKELEVLSHCYSQWVDTRFQLEAAKKILEKKRA